MFPCWSKYWPPVARDEAALVVVFQYDVDDARDGVGAVLGCGFVGEHFNVIDGGQRNEAQVRPRGALNGLPSTPRLAVPWRRLPLINTNVSFGLRPRNRTYDIRFPVSPLMVE